MDNQQQTLLAHICAGKDCGPKAAPSHVTAWSALSMSLKAA